MRSLCAAFLVCAALHAPAAPKSPAATRVTLLHFSDYHSHALPFYSEDRPEQGGIARAVAYLRAQKKVGALVFSGGDSVNKGSPSWSDKYGCAEWPWLNGVVDAMAFGNHEPDYGREAFDRCAAAVHYPILSANTEGFKATTVLTTKGVKVGVFALAGGDFKTLVHATGFTFSDPIAAARAAVRKLREDEHADVVVMIGHQHLDDDFAMARAVPGIDLIFGSHSHLKRDLEKIPGTSTWFISPFQYLTYVSRVELTVENHHVTAATGGLVRIDGAMKADPVIAKRVAEMQSALEADPQYAPLFKPIATLKSALSVDALGHRTVEIMRSAVNADLALSTASSFRQPIAPGTVTREELYAAMPYENEIQVKELSGTEVKALLAFAETKKGTDSYPYVARPETIYAARTYRVATTDFMAKVATGYKDFFKGVNGTGVKVREQVEAWLAKQ
jgi:5'-nucleotidase